MLAQDWTKGGVKTLVLYFYGAADNGAGQLYVKINNVKVEYKGNAAAIMTADVEAVEHRPDVGCAVCSRSRR